VFMCLLNTFREIQGVFTVIRYAKGEISTGHVKKRRAALAAAPPLPKSFEDAARHHMAVAEELERVCGSSHFRTSKRSCEFLRYIVRVTLDGRMDSLKERSIGIDLFGRDTSYEPSSDATVRVRANEVRKRLNSYYALPSSVAEIRTVRIDLPTGSYVPRFLPLLVPGRLGSQSDAVDQLVRQPILSPVFSFDRPAIASPAVVAPMAPPIRALTLMRPALLALLVCTLLLRHQLENREEYLRFWDRLLAGRSALALSVSPQDRISLASSLYPLVWVAGRYGVDAVLQGDSLAGPKPEAASSVQVSYITPPENAADRRLRWAVAAPAESSVTANSRKFAVALLDRRAADGRYSGGISASSAALLTILPEDISTLHIQGTDADAIRRLLEGLTVERSFPASLVEGVERLDSRHALQVLLFRNASGEWKREIYWGDA
jgi:hypothetical protein